VRVLVVCAIHTHKNALTHIHTETHRHTYTHTYSELGKEGREARVGESLGP